jgi:hypothetical protein
MPSNLLILPLLGGFLFLHLCHRFRFRAQRSDGYRLLFESSIAAALLLLLARVSVVVIRSTPAGGWLKSRWDVFAPIPYLGTGSAALILGVLLGYTYNWLNNPDPLRERLSWRHLRQAAQARSRRNSERARDTEIQNHGSALIRLIHKAEKDSILVSITLSSRKWYVGYIAEAWSLDPQEAYFRLLPILSGYREKDTLQAIRTTDYIPVFRDPTVDTTRFVVVLALRDVQMASLFDERVYEEHFAGSNAREAHLGQPDTSPKSAEAC